MKRKNKITPNGISVLIFVLLSLVSLFSADLFGNMGSGKYYILAFITLAVFLPATIIVAKKSNMTPKNFLKLKKIKARWIPLIFFTAFTVSLLSMMLNALVYKISGTYFGDALANPVSSVSWENPFGTALAVIVFPAIFEELFFRGAYLAFYKKSGLLKAIIASSLCFAFMHASPYNLLGPFIAGIACCILTVILDSVYPAVLCHIINNLMSCVIVYYAPSINSSGLAGFTVIVGIIMLLVFAYLMLCTVEPYLNRIKDPQKKPLSQRRLERMGRVNAFSTSFFVLMGLFVLKIIAIFCDFWG